MELHRCECSRFRSDRPCLPHKLRGQVCDGCTEYDPTAERVLVIKLAAIGDVLRTTCLLRGLHEKHHARIVWLTRPEAAPLLAHNPSVDEIWCLDDKGMARLDAETFRAVINTDTDRLSAGLATMARSVNKFGYSLNCDGSIRCHNEAAERWFSMGINDTRKRQNQCTYQQIVAGIAEVPPTNNELILHLTDAERAAAALQLSALSHRPSGLSTPVSSSEPQVSGFISQPSSRAFPALGLNPQSSPFPLPASPSPSLLSPVPCPLCTGLVGLNTGGAGRWKRKQWTFDGFLALGRRILSETDYSILLLGADAEEDFNTRLESTLRSGAASDFVSLQSEVCGLQSSPPPQVSDLRSHPSHSRVARMNTQYSVRHFAAMIGLCDVLVTGDTLGMHIALALGKQLVVLFGPTSHTEIELYGRGTKIVPEMECQSFYRSDCSAYPCCIETITADRVFAAVQERLAVA